MPSTENIQNSKQDKDFSNGNESGSTDIQSPRETPPNKPVRDFGLSKKIKRETQKLFGYPGKAMKRSASYEVNNLGDKEDVVYDDFSSYFKEHDILMEL